MTTPSRPAARSDDPLLVFGPRSTAYDFGPGHPLTPRRFGPGIDLLRAVGAEPGLAPEPATDDELLMCHAAMYVEAVRRFSADPLRLPEAGLGTGDDPAFAGMHEAGATVAGGSIGAIEVILRGDVLHAFHPGGGLHHAMRTRASGFCIYNDVALAIARARRDGLRVLYVDLDVHHGDGVQALHDADPGVLTFSIHETGRSLFPGTGFLAEVGEGAAAGTKVNLPLEPFTGAEAWLAAIERVLPAIAAAFGPDIVVSQHGADSHVLDPLAHLRNTTTSMGAAARLVDAIAHRWAGGRWLATGGGGYDAYRVVPRSWSLVWLAGAHREAPDAIPEAWRERWAAEAARYGQSPLPIAFTDPVAAELVPGGRHAVADRAAAEIAERVRDLHVPALVRTAEDLGWWSAADALRRPAGDEWTGRASASVPSSAAGGPDPTIVSTVDADTWSRLRMAPRVVAPADPGDGHALLAGALAGAGSPVVTAAVSGEEIVGLTVSAVPRSEGSAGPPGSRQLLALGVAPAFRGRGLGKALLRAHLDSLAAAGHAGLPLEARVTVAERDPSAPVGRETRAEIARSVLAGAGFKLLAAPSNITQTDPSAVVARLAPRG